MPGASPSRRNSLTLIAVWTPGGGGTEDSGRLSSCRRLRSRVRRSASDVCSLSESDSSVYRLKSCVHSSRVGVLTEQFKVAWLALFALRPLGRQM